MKADLSPILTSLHNLIGDHNVKNKPSDYVYDTTQSVPIYLQAELPPVDPIYDFDIKIDGEHTFEQRPTHCGFSHYLHGESYDVLLDPLNINDKIGVNPGDNVEQVFMEYFKLRGLEGRVNHEELARHIREKASENEDFRNIVNSKETTRRKRQKLTSQIPPVPKSAPTKPAPSAAPKKPAAPKNTKQETAAAPIKLVSSANVIKVPSEHAQTESITKSASDTPLIQEVPIPAPEQRKSVSSKSVDLVNISNEKALEERKRRNEENLRRQKEQREREEKQKKEREIQQMLQNIDSISFQKRLQATNTFIARVQLFGSRSVVGIQCQPGDTYLDLRGKLEAFSQIRDYHLVITTGSTHSFVDDDDFVQPMVTVVQIPTNASS